MDLEEENINEKNTLNIEENKIQEVSNNINEEEPIKEQEDEDEAIKNNESDKNNDDKKTYKPVKPEKKKKQLKWGVAIIVIVALVLIIIFASTIFALVNLGSENIVDGVSIKGIDLVGLNVDDAKLEIEEAIRNEFAKNVILRYEDYETSISPEQIEAKYNVEKAIENAYNVGRAGNIIKNNYDIIFAMLLGKNIDIDFSYNDKALTDMVNDISKKIPGSVKDNSYYIEGEKLIITKGKPGITIKTEEMKKRIIEQVKNPVKNFLEIEVENSIPEAINIDKIYQDVKKDPQNAYVSQNPFTIHPAEDGIDFAISLEEARQMVIEDKEEYEIPLKYIKPEISTSDIGTEAFPDLLTKFSTRYEPGNVNRTTNLKLASDKINGTVLLPGEEFSYNKVVGERTIAAGYKEAAIYSGGEVVDGLGGGICQISSTLYNVAVQANMEITERSNHQFVTSYIEAGKDATVVYGYIDFKFKNTRNYPVKIESSVNGGIAEMKIYGVKEENEFDIKLETEVISTIPFTVKYVDDNTLDAGVEVVKQGGASGYKTITYKVCRLNGAVVSRTVMSNDTYSAMTKIIRRGTRGTQTVKSTSPEQTKTEINTPSTTTTQTNAKPANKSTTNQTTTVTTVKPGNNAN